MCSSHRHQLSILESFLVSCAGLESLTFDGAFNQNLDDVASPSGLQSLTLGDAFRSLEGVDLPKRSAKLGRDLPKRSAKLDVG